MKFIIKLSLKLILILYCFLEVQFNLLFADDGWVKVEGGSARLMEECSSVSMNYEYVRIELMPEKYKVTATFKFYNSGDPIQVSVGFPVRGGGDGSIAFKDQQFITFKTWVNSKLVQTNDVRSDTSLSGDYQYFKVKDIYFPSKKITTSIVEYEAPYGFSSNTPTGSSCHYDYGTGGSWKGPIGTAIIDIRFNEEYLGLNIHFDDDFKLIHRSSGQVVYRIDSLNPKRVSALRIDDYCDNKYCTGNYNSGYFCYKFVTSDTFHISDKNMLFTSYINIPTLLVLRLQRNSIFARYGKIFKDLQLQSFFNQLNWNKPRNNYMSDDEWNIINWYKPQKSFSEKQLKYSDWQKIKELSIIEKNIIESSELKILVPDI